VKKLVKITIFEHQQNGDPKWSFFFSRQGHSLYKKVGSLLAGGPVLKQYLNIQVALIDETDWYIDTEFVIRGSKKFRHEVYGNAIIIVCYVL
jgi:hypothetical protein